MISAEGPRVCKMRRPAASSETATTCSAATGIVPPEHGSELRIAPASFVEIGSDPPTGTSTNGASPGPTKAPVAPTEAAAETTVACVPSTETARTTGSTAATSPDDHTTPSDFIQLTAPRTMPPPQRDPPP